MSLGSKGCESSVFVAKNSGATLCYQLFTSSACFAPSFVSQTKYPKCTQIVQNRPKHEYRIQWGGSGAFLREIRTRLHGTNFCTSSARFALSFARQPNGPKCIQIVWNAPKHEFMVQRGGSGPIIAWNSDATSWHELFHKFGPFCTESRKQTKLFKMHPNCLKRAKMSIGNNGVDRVRSLRKISMRLRGNEPFALVRPILHRVSKAIKLSQYT